MGLLTPNQAEALALLPRKDRAELLGLLQEAQRRKGQRAFFSLFPDKLTEWDGPTTPIFRNGETIYPRALYPRHLEHFAAGHQYRERCFMAANRVGKTVAGGYELTCHLTGLYPDWWIGRRFERPTSCWAAGKTNESTRDILQAKLCGPTRFIGSRKALAGTGIIPGHLLDLPTWKQGVNDLVDTIRVRHVSGDWSELGFKSYKQGRGSFEGTEKDVIELDEEPPDPIYGECLIRTATTNGIITITFTPLEGLSEVVLSFLPADQRPAQIDEKAEDYSYENFGTPEDDDE